MKRQLRWVSLVSLGGAIAIGAVGCLGEESDDTSVSIGAVSLGDALPGTNAAQFSAAKANFGAHRDTAGRARPDLQRAELLGLPLGRRDRRRRAEHRAALRDIDQWGLQLAGVDGRLAAAAVRHRRLQSEPRPQLPVGHRRQSGAGRHHLRGPRDDADLRRRPGRADSRLHHPGDRGRAAERHTRRRGLRHHPPHRRSVRPRAEPRRAVRLEGRPRQRDRLRRRRLPQRDGHYHHQLRSRHGGHRLRHREPRQPGPHQRRHQRLPR